MPSPFRFAPALGLILLTAISVSAATSLSLELRQKLACSPPQELIPVALILHEQVSFVDLYPQVMKLPKSERRSRVIGELRSLAQKSQADLLADLRQLENARFAERIRPLWISNAVAVHLRADELPRLVGRHPEIERVHWDPPRAFSEIADDHQPGRSVAATDEMGWGLVDIHAPQVWSLGYRGQGVVIGNIDTGVDYNHPDLADHIWVNPGEDLNGNGVVDSSDWNGIDDDHNGYVDDLRGWAFDFNSPEVMDQDPMGHGTATSGIVAGDGTGGNTTGVAPEAKLMILKNTSGESNYWEAQQYAILMGADVITSSLSYKWYYNPRPDYATMRQNTDMELAAGIIHSNSIGNQGNQQELCPIPFNIATPGNCPPPWLHPDQTLVGGVSSVLGNGAYDAAHQIKAYSGVGPAAWYLPDILFLDPNYPYQASWPARYNDYPYQNAQYIALLKPDLAAPTDVMTTELGGGYMQIFTGTSAATPHTGGTLCLLLSANPDATPETLARILMTTAIDMGPPGKDNNWGAGRLDAYAALIQLLTEISGTLTGVVSDSNTGEPIYQASVDLPELQLWAQTDTSGHYLLTGIPPGTHDVRFAATGYDTLIVPQVSFSIAVTETLSVSLTGPLIEVDPEQITATLPWGDSLQAPVTVHNAGSSDLIVNLTKQGDWALFSVYRMIQAQAITGDAKLFGIEVAGGSIWITGGNNELEPNFLYRFSYEGELLDTLLQPPSSSTWGWYDLAWDGQLLYGSSGQEIEGMDLEGNVQDTINGPLELHRALAYNPQTDLFYSADNTSDIVEFGRNGAVVQSWTHNLHIQGLAWHPQDEDGYPLYIFSQDGAGALLQVSKMDPATGDILLAADLIGGPSDQAGGAAISGEVDPARWCFLGIAQSALDRIQIHSLNAYAPWLSIEPTAQVIPPGATLDATALFDAGAVSPGPYDINLVIEHNAAGPEVVIPTSLTVQPTAVNDPAISTLPEEFRAGAVYPNPFNAETAIPLELPQRSQVKIELFNVRGQCLGVIFEGVQNAGWAKISYNASHLASGIYFYRVAAQGLERGGNFQKTAKMLLLK